MTSTGLSARPTTIQMTHPSSTLPAATIITSKRKSEARMSETLSADRATTKVTLELVGAGRARTRSSPRVRSCRLTSPPADRPGRANAGKPCAAVLAPSTRPSAATNWT